MPYTDFENQIQKSFFEIIGVNLSKEQCQMFFDYMNILIEKNKVMNLTTITEPSEIIMKHFVDSAILVKFFGKELLDNKKVIDIGTGAGFPGLPLAIICPETKFVLSDTLGKRISFLKEVVEGISVKNVELIKARAEDLGNDLKFREQFDYSVSRAVSRVSVLSEYTLPFIKVGGKLIAYKMDDCEEELKEGLKAITTLGGMFHVKHSYTLKPDEPKRCLLVIDKIKSTPKKYPRKAGTPNKEPIE